MSQSVRWMTCFAMSLFGASVAAQSIMDSPVPIIEKADLVLAENIGGEIAWINDKNLLATVLLDDPRSRWWVRRVVNVDVRSGQAVEFLARGFVSCSNPVAGLIGISSGTLAANYEGGSKEPRPSPHLYKRSFWSSTLVPLKDEDEWNKWLCIKTSKAELNDPGAGNPQSDHRYLQTPDELLRITKELNETRSDVVYGLVLERGKEKIQLADLTPSEVGWRPQFLPFLNKHLLGAGEFIFAGDMVLPGNKRTQEIPTITMTKDGKIEREYVRDRLLSKGFKRDASVIPYAKGNLVFIQDRPSYGGGIYRETGGLVERIWCVNKGNGFDRKCRPQAISMSPDGCSLAFFDEGSDDLKKSVPRISLKILDVCH
ncbi:hypothetical protein [Uliginosibacterium aquaticum]|uniref:Uncharacterized protein n=1 Tax=Uliginosibacterium aquaticum TaxID=2731212 RepID=A0ABX2IGD2_9RHOO|nr:hypothetical protein [Uliginosibacterium aquaticum]NSL55776.1 hypothetical protein [Uliginosibacterium aquaticum]